MVWDGDCGFCKLCADRFGDYRDKKVKLVSYQELSKKYPDAPKEDFSKSVFLFTPSGNSYSGAEAIFRFFAEYSWRGWAFNLYQKSKPFSFLSEWAYRLVANHRNKFKLLVNFFYGKSFIQSSFHTSGWLFARFLGLTIFFAFISLWSQISGLIGSSGIAPFSEYLSQLQSSFSDDKNFLKWLIKPTLLWFFEGDSGLDFLFLSGTVASIFLFFGFIPHISVLIIWICYLSFVVVSRPFLNFQWDLLLLETVLISFLFLPWVIREKIGSGKESNLIGRWLVWLLLFKLMFESGVVKFTYFGGDGSNHWINLSALDFHFWTQPIPSQFSWYFHWLPGMFHKLSLIIAYIVELIFPFFIFLPRRFRNISCAGFIFLQVMIIITGNYGFFNLLTIALCLTLIDDQSIPENLKKYFIRFNSNFPMDSRYLYIKNFIGVFHLIVFLITGLFFLRLDFYGNKKNKSNDYFQPSFITTSLVELVRFSRSINSYGLFRVMTDTRPEIIISYSDDGEKWEPYLFRYKPVELNTPPRFFLPHMPRLDWQLWFEALYIERLIKSPVPLSLYKRFLEVMIKNDIREGDITIERFFTKSELSDLNKLDKRSRQAYLNNWQFYIRNYIDHSYWFGLFLRGLAKKSPSIHDLLSLKNTIISEPKWLRIELYYYNFSSPKDKEIGFWWSRKKIEEFSLSVFLGDS